MAWRTISIEVQAQQLGISAAESLALALELEAKGLCVVVDDGRAFALTDEADAVCRELIRRRPYQ